MLVLLFCQSVAVLTAVDQPQASLTPDVTSKVESNRPFHEISQEMRTLMRGEAAAEDEFDRFQAVIGLTDLYAEIMQDPRLAESDTLQSYRVKLRSRLLSVQKELQTMLARQAKQRARDPLGAVNDELRAIVESQMTLQLALYVPSGGSRGGPATLLGSSGFGWPGGGMRRDAGADLVALIHHTISPESWDVNGGKGTIYYYWPWYALVVRNTAEVHHKIGGLSSGLRGGR